MDILKSTLQKYDLSNKSDQVMASKELFDNHAIKIQIGDGQLIVRYHRWSPQFSLQNELLKCCRGTILDINTLSPQCWTFQMRREYPDFHRDVDFSDVKVYKYYDGTMVNLYFNEKKEDWCYSTKGMLDAYQSKWNSTLSF